MNNLGSIQNHGVGLSSVGRGPDGHPGEEVAQRAVAPRAVCSYSLLEFRESRCNNRPMTRQESYGILVHFVIFLVQGRLPINIVLYYEYDNFFSSTIKRM